MLIRECHLDDRRSLETLGHPPDAIETLTPTCATRIAWMIQGIRVRSFVLEDSGAAVPRASVQFVRSRIDRGTWMFGHWRVSPIHRGRGTGSALLRGALRRVAGVLRLYSLIEAHNEVSIRAHERLGFERASSHCGGGPLGYLSTLGPPAPAVRLVEIAGPAGHREMLALYRRSMGPLWLRLFPRLDEARFQHAAAEPPDPGHPGHPAARIPRRAMVVGDPDKPAALLMRAGRRTRLFCDPERCDAGLVARVAGRLLDLGGGRDEWLTLRGMPRDSCLARGPIRRWIVMGKTDLGDLRSG